MKLKKRYIILIIFGLIIGVIALPRLNNAITINQLNENSDFGYDFLYEFSDEELEEFYILEGFGMETIYSQEYPEPFEEDNELDINLYLEENPFTYYDLSGYPTILGSFRLTGLNSSNPDYHLFGIQIGDSYSFEEIDDIMNDYHYHLERTSEYDNHMNYRYEKARVTIRIIVTDDVVQIITVRISSIPIPGIVF